ncbi:LysM peptidoglycan-binding domain-containing protein [Aliiroseovarius subalbicans]|uniref:LysM peptidoglycan-binding domain-containing protein n=1 Tax=Aliiroseovarius subalbicans TaxID=2925840 RepID=UPI001F57AFF6|nr:LysM peptidoglycan-binding domain-containing protein [Aliiroseovarius subalbicans]MCI2398689.1 LysM peptidoglycan-binding domain-containing protein [Aliiroseovarius subalbicans]
MAAETPGTGKTSGLAMAGGGIGALVLVAATYVFFSGEWRGKPGEEPAVQVAEPVTPTETPEIPTPPETSEGGEGVAAPEQMTESSDAAPVTTAETTTEAPPVAAPFFDVVRVDGDGNAVIAGQGTPGVPVHVLVDGISVAVAEPDASGNFVALFALDGDEVPRVMTLSSGGEAVEISSQSVIVAPTTPTPTPTPTQTAEPTQSAEAAPGDATQADPTTTPEANVPDPAPAGSPAPDTAVPQVLLADNEGITVLQDGSAGPAAIENVTIDSIAYDEEGGVALTGRGQGAANVRIYLDNVPIKTTRIAEDGGWRVPLPDVETGVYTLRVDEISADGTVTSRTETPFKREEPATLVARDDAGLESGSVEAPPVQQVTVQPGSTLWAIAREKYGEGVLYVRVFEANKDRIRNPDLIYPGQVFEMPNE